MGIERYDHYGTPRLIEGPKGFYLFRDVLQDNGRFSGICEYGVYSDSETMWYICREGSEFDKVKPFLSKQDADNVDTWTEG